MPATRSRKLRLSPVQGAVLRLLEEAGSEEIPVVLNTLQAQFPSYPPGELLPVAEQAIGELCKLGLVAFSRDYGAPGLHYVQIPVDQPKGSPSLQQLSTYDEARKAWKWADRSGDSELISLILTEQGTRALTE